MCLRARIELKVGGVGFLILQSVNMAKKKSQQIARSTIIKQADFVERFRFNRSHFEELLNEIGQFISPTTMCSRVLFSTDDLSHSRRLDQIRSNKKKSLSQFFTSRVIPIWNKLPHSIVNAKSLESFKNMLHKLPQTDIIPISRIR
jgi:hypothetical protein